MTPLILLALSAVDAPVTQVTVFTDQARVVRTATVAVKGDSTIEFPPLRDSVDVSSVKVESANAEVKRVDIERIAPERLRTDAAKKVLAELDKVDTELERLGLERAAMTQQLEMLHRIAPVAPTGDPLKPAPKLNAAGWVTAGQFAPDQLGKVQTKLREVERNQKKANEARNKLLEQAHKLGNPQTTSGWKVLAQVSGNGNATFTLTYLVRGAAWTPTWDLQLQPETNSVSLSLAGLVSQSTGEDWTQATLLMSTAIPSHAVKVPKLATWKIGVADRFIPTPTPMYAAIAPAPAVPASQRIRSEEDLVRARLQRLGVSVNLSTLRETTVAGKNSDKKKSTFDFSGESIDGELVQPEGDIDEDRRFYQPTTPAAPPPPPARVSASVQSMPGVAMEMEEVTVASDSVSTTMGGALGYTEGRAAQPIATFSLSPPPAWRPPSFGPNSPVTLAAGYDLSFTSLQKETVPTAGGTRRVALWSAQWPVTVERKLYPALTTDAFLVAELKNPSQQVLPGGPAQLYVGADPAGTARLKLVSPGESFTLPLGIDRALKPIRNVQLVEATKGVFSKDDIGTYVVTIELVNPYPTPIAVRVLDQFPVTDQKDLETKLIETKPTATQDQKKGSLEWRLTIPSQQKQVFSFTYTLKRPKGWKLQQQEVVR